jgi:glyoxylase-like metal-dependent hydrolase (beta-lactamase superfamily II)
LIWLVLLATPAFAQEDLSEARVTTLELGQGLAMLQGAGGNVAVSTGRDGTLLVDDQFAPLTEKLRSAVAALSPDPIRFVLNTHWHGDHTGGNENFGRGGAVILAHDRVRARLTTEQFMAGGGLRRVPPAPRAAWPIVTFQGGVLLHLNGLTIEVTHVQRAHTDGDSIVRFVEADVLHLGDVFFSGVYPFFDASSGGGIDGMVEAADAALAMTTPETRIIPGHGPLSDSADLRASREMLSTIRDRVRKMIERGLDRAAVVRARPSREFDARYGGGFLAPDRFVGLVYDSLTTD